MRLKDFNNEINKVRTILQQYYKGVTVSASYGIKSCIFISVKTPSWEYELEWREDDPLDITLSEHVCNVIKIIHKPDINFANESDTSDYTLDVKWSEEDREYIATCPTFPGLSAFGSTEQEALAEGKIALKLFIQSCLEDPSYERNKIHI